MRNLKHNQDVRSVKAREPRRQQIIKDVAAFLARGGKVEFVEIIRRG